MSEAKFTPGPWGYDSNVGVIHGAKRYGTIAETADGSDFQGVSCNALYEVCTLTWLQPMAYSRGNQEFPVRLDVQERVRQRLRANAALIAAAPELYEALEACAESLALCRDALGMCGHGDGRDRKADREDIWGTDSALNEARAALKKARGE